MDPLYLNKNRWQESKNEYPLFGKEKKKQQKTKHCQTKGQNNFSFIEWDL